MDQEKTTCPKCKEKIQVKKNGTYRGKQRYFCSQCKRSFQLNYSAPVIEDESLIINKWFTESKNLSQTAESNNITIYYLKKMIIKKYDVMLKEAEQQVERLNEGVQKEENKKMTCMRELKAEPLYNYGEINRIKGLINESEGKKAELMTESRKAERRLKELKELKEPKDVPDDDLMSAAEIYKNSKETIDFRKFKKFLRKELEIRKKAAILLEINSNNK